MRKITYGCLTLVLLLLFLSGCGTQGANDTANHNEMDMTAAPISSEAAQTPAATEKEAEATPKAATSEPTPTPITPVKTEQPIIDTEEPSEAVTVHTVEITNFAFSPEKLEISQGDIVIFINKDEVKHSATADNGDFDTGLLAQNASMEVTFLEAGEFGYYCMPHPGMKGTIVVKGK